MVKKLDLTKYKVIRELDGSISYARWHKGGHIGGGGGLGGGSSYNAIGADVPAQWRLLDTKRHYKIIAELEQAVKDGRMKVTPMEQIISERDFIENPVTHEKYHVIRPWDLSPKLFKGVWSIFLIGFLIYGIVYLPIEMTMVIGLVAGAYFYFVGKRKQPVKRQFGNLAINQPSKEQLEEEDYICPQCGQSCSKEEYEYGYCLDCDMQEMGLDK